MTMSPAVYLSGLCLQMACEPVPARQHKGDFDVMPARLRKLDEPTRDAVQS